MSSNPVPGGKSYVEKTPNKIMVGSHTLKRMAHFENTS
jgi:hypothetical protein